MFKNGDKVRDKKSISKVYTVEKIVGEKLYCNRISGGGYKEFHINEVVKLKN